MRSAVTNFPGGANYSAVLFADLREMGAEDQSISGSETAGTRSFNHPVIEVQFELSHNDVPGLVHPLTGPYEIIVYWEGLGASSNGEIKKLGTGHYNSIRQKLIVKERLDLGIGDPGLYKLMVVVVLKQEPINEIAGFLEMGVIQRVDSIQK